RLPRPAFDRYYTQTPEEFRSAAHVPDGRVTAIFRVSSIPKAKPASHKQSKCSHLKCGDQREVVRGEQGGATAVHAEGGKAQVTVVVEMIQMQHRKDSGVSVGISEQCARSSRFECFSHEA